MFEYLARPGVTGALATLFAARGSDWLSPADLGRLVALMGTDLNASVADSVEGNAS